MRSHEIADFPESPILETSAYHPPGTTKLGETDAGPIYRIPISYVQMSPAICHHPLFEKITRSRHHRRQIETKLHWNSRYGHREIGKPNSAYLVSFGDQLFVDHLLENPLFERDGLPKLHEFMHQRGEYRCVSALFSGHLAPLKEPRTVIHYVLALDAYEGSDQYERLDPRVRIIMGRLCGSGIFPLTSDAYPIRPQ